MRNALILLLALIGLWSIDVFVLDGRGSTAVLENAGIQGQIVRYDVERWLRRRGFTSAIRRDDHAHGG